MPGLVRHTTINCNLARELGEMTRRRARGQWLYRQDVETDRISADLRNASLSDEAL